MYDDSYFYKQKGSLGSTKKVHETCRSIQELKPPSPKIVNFMENCVTISYCN